MKKRVMIVDDDPSILITIREIFEPEGFEVYAVSSGEDCLEELKKGFKGVILMDIMMPHMDGWETIKEIVKNGYHDDVVISMLTAKNLPDEEIDELKDYIQDYFTKPFEGKKLVSAVDSYFTKCF
ncbi:MAG: response regulator transcription factor [Candidatus Thermoplasmatota archaeon]